MYRKDPKIVPPWGGFDNSSPALTLPQNSFRVLQNWFINKQRLQPFPKLTAFTLPNDTIFAMRSFFDIQSFYHTVLLGVQKAYYFKPGPAYDVINPGAWTPPTALPYATEVMQNRLFFTNGFDLRYIQGDSNWYPAGDANAGSKYIGKLASKLILANVFENAFQSPARIKYSATNNPLEWDNALDYTAGEFDIADVEDEITGWATINNVGFAFRKFGITSITPTGVGASPFYVENFSLGQAGIGCYYNHTLAVYGTFCAFVAVNEIYYFDGGAPQPIGGKSKKTILAELDSASSTPFATFLGTLNKGVDYVAYIIAIPQNGDTTTSLWWYAFDSQTWFNVQLTGVVRSLANLVVA